MSNLSFKVVSDEEFENGLRECKIPEFLIREIMDRDKREGKVYVGDVIAAYGDNVINRKEACS